MAARGCHPIPGNKVFPGQRRCQEPPRRSHLPPRSRAHQGGASPSCREIPGSPYRASPEPQKRGGRCRPAPAPAPALVGKGQGASLRHPGLGTAVSFRRISCASAVPSPRCTRRSRCAPGQFASAPAAPRRDRESPEGAPRCPPPAAPAPPGASAGFALPVTQAQGMNHISSLQLGYLNIITMSCFTRDTKAQSSSGLRHAAR